MEGSPQEATTAGDQDRLQPEQRRVRRRLVQSTLFPPKPQENAAEREREDCEKEDGDDDEEYCGSKRKTKRKPKPRASKKVAINYAEIPSSNLDGKHFQDTVKSSSFSRASGEEHPQKEQQCVGSPEENDKTCSPLESAANMVSPQQLKRRVNSTPKRKQIQTTPKKKVINGGLRDTCPDLISDNTVQSGNATQAIPDLRLEEKMKAEENARIFGGRQMHPFFSSRKMAKKNQEVVDVESYHCCVERKDISTNFSPVHVFEEDHDDSGSLDWGNWKLSERSFISTTCDLKSLCSPVPERSVSALHFDDFLNVCLSSRPLPHNGAIQHEEVSLDRSPVQSEHRHATSPILSADEPVVHSEVSKDIEVGILPSSLQCWQDNILEKSDLLSGNATPVRNLDGAREDCKMEKTDLLSGNATPLRNSERMTTYYHSCSKCPENSLWTNKYLPEKAFEVRSQN